MGVALSTFGDLINHTLPAFKNKGAFEAAFDYQRFVVTDQWFTQDRLKFQDGNQIEWREILNDDGSARFVDQFENATHNYIDVAKKASSPWVRLEGHAVWEQVEASLRRNASSLLDYMKSRFYVAVLSLLNKIESSAFGVPQDTNDSKTPRGVRYWVSFLNSGTTDYTGGFNGRTIIWGDGTTTTSKGGIDGAIEPKWRNWVANHNGLTPTTLDTLARGLAYTNFIPPRDIKEFYNPKRQTRRIYSSINYGLEYERLLNMGPDNKNGDLRRFHGQDGILDFRGVEWLPIAHLENASYNPIYVLSMPNFFPFVHSDWWMERSEALRDVSQHTVWHVFWDCLFNFGCDNVRNQIVLHSPF